MNVTHNGVVITYREGSNDWFFELRGRERAFGSLAKAKEAIDKPVKEKKTFERVKGYVTQYGDVFKPCEITSIAEKTRWGQEVWVNCNGDRSKVSHDKVYLATPENDAKIAAWKELDKQADEIQEKKDMLVSEMQKFEVPKEEA